MLNTLILIFFLMFDMSYPNLTFEKTLWYTKKMRTSYLGIGKRYLTTGIGVKPKISIVGAGPAGFYAAQHLAKKLNNAQIDIYEKLPVPFGLVRFGVAPDHPEVKNVINTFTKTAENPNVRFFGNVNLGQDISLKQLQDAYHAVLLTYGAEQSRALNIPGENLTNVLSARNIVGWYNGTPWDANLQIDLSGPTVAIFGQGNVAIDVARILLTPVDKLKCTDITEHSLVDLSKSHVKEVHLIGRRGPLQAAFTIAELREMLKLQSCATCWCAEDFDNVSEITTKLGRPKKRISELMLKSLSDGVQDNCIKQFKPKFFRSPLEIIGSNKVEKINLGVNELVGDDLVNKKSVLTNKREFLQCNLAVTSIGYKSIQVDPDIPFNKNLGIAENCNGLIKNRLYAAGWLSTGPTGVILTTMNNAFATAELIIKDLVTSGLSSEKPGHLAIEAILKEGNVQIVEWKNWQNIDAYEQHEGKKVGKPREKLLNIKKMLEIAS